MDNFTSVVANIDDLLPICESFMLKLNKKYELYQKELNSELEKFQMRWSVLKKQIKSN